MAIVGRAKNTHVRAPFALRLLELSRVRVCISPAPQSPSPKLETTRSLVVFNLTPGNLKFPLSSTIFSSPLRDWDDWSLLWFCFVYLYVTFL